MRDRASSLKRTSLAAISEIPLVELDNDVAEFYL
jgi:hypothetical protein